MSALKNLNERLHGGPEPAFTADSKRLRGRARRLLLRLMRPFIAYQERVNIGVVDVLSEHEEAIRCATLTEARLMAELRRIQRTGTEAGSEEVDVSRG